MQIQSLYSAVPILLLSLCVQASGESIATLGWMTGCWAAVGQEAGSGEYWTAPAGGSMLGVSRTVRGGRTVGFEFMRIADNDSAQLAFFARPSGQPGAMFPMVQLTDNEVVFENPAHDFPQRVIYRRLPDNGLLGRIEGRIDGDLRSVDFPMQRAECG